VAKKTKPNTTTDSSNGMDFPDPWAVLYEGLSSKQEIMDNVQERIIRPLWESIDPKKRSSRRIFSSCWSRYCTALLESKGESMEAFVQRFQFSIFEEDIADWYEAAVDGKRADWRKVRERMRKMLAAIRKEKDQR
jgi:hypothetical protein